MVTNAPRLATSCASPPPRGRLNRPGAARRRLTPPTARLSCVQSAVQWKAGEDMARANDWAGKVMALVNGGNTAAAIAQIKVAPSVKDLKALQTIMTLSRITGKYRQVDAAIADNLALLSAPR